MQRLPTSFALSAWLGFHAVTGASEIAQLFGISAIGGHLLEPAAGRNGESIGVAILTLGTAALVAAALVLVHSTDDDRMRRGEKLAFAGVGVSTAMVLAALLFGAPFANVFDRLDLALWSVGLSLVALAFDNCVFAPDEPDDEMAFRRTVAVIDASIPREHDRRARAPRNGGGEA